jgi:hypothetical protein
MTRRVAVVLPALLPFAVAGFAFQGERNRASPHETVSADLSGDKIQISYGRPSLKGRQVGKQVAPFGEVWRLGADEATKITLSAKTTLGDKLELAPGSYALFAIPGADKWTLIVNKTANQWGAFSYKEGDDLGRIEVPVQKQTAPVERFTIELKKQSQTTVDLTMSWGTQAVRTTLKAS